jgi:hypothetical protein
VPQSNADWGKRPSTNKTTQPHDIGEIDKLVKGQKTGQTARINAEIDEDLRARFKAKCAMQKREIKDVLTELIEAWLK